MKNTVATQSSLKIKKDYQLRRINIITDDTLEPTNFLTKWYKEDAFKYNWRKDNAIFVDFFTPTAKAMTGLIFRKQPRIEGDERFTQDIDLNNTSLLEFIQQITYKAITDGLSFVVCETTLSSSNQNVTMQDEINGKVRSYLKHYTYNDYVSHRVNSKGLITQIIFKFNQIEYTGEFDSEIKTYYKVYKPTGGSLYVKDKNNYIKVDEWSNSLGYIPLSVVYGGDKRGVLDGYPILKNLADLNFKHLELSSGLDNIVHIASNPVPIVYGTPLNQDIKIGVNTPIMFPQKEQHGFEWVELHGNSVGVAERQLEKLENHIKHISIAKIGERTTKNIITATEIKEDSEKNKSVLNLIASSLQSCIDSMLFDLAILMGKTQPFIDVVLSYDFDSSMLDSEVVKTLNLMRTNGNLSLETLLNVLVKGELLPDNFNVEEEVLRINTELEGGV